jgi:integrase
MASIKRRGSSWQATYRGPNGRERSKSFRLRVEAEGWVSDELSALRHGTWIDPKAGKTTFGDFARAWQAAQVHRPTTAATVDSALRNHILPTFEARPVASIRPSEVQAWVRGITGHLSPATVRVVVQDLRAIFNAAVRDQVIARSPCVGVKLPANDRPQVQPLETAEVLRLIEALPKRYRGLAVLGAGAGLRSGEALGVSTDEIDFLRRSLSVRQQLVTLPSGETVLAPPKTSSSVRTVPLPDFVTMALAEHLTSLPKDYSGLLFTMPDGRPISRNRFGDLWRGAVKTAAVRHGVRFHELRHYYASLLIRHGESVKTVQARLGHASAVETLNTYAHLWPDSEDRTRTAIDDVLLRPADISRTLVATAD